MTAFAPLRVVLLGSTGSIGRQVLEIVRAHPTQVRIIGLAAARSAGLLEEQVEEFRPAYYFLGGGERAAFSASGRVRRLPMEEMACLPEADLIVVATVGRAGLAPTMAALEAGKRVALANKEVLVMAGEAVTAAAQRGGGTLLPVDSEHSAIWQCLQGESGEGGPTRISRLMLTASGGAFRDRSVEELRAVTPEQALRHPNWQMGPKVTVDSATLMNKGFEVIEAHWLFGVPLDRIDVVLHRESIIHSLVEFVDGSIKAQLGAPDMRLPLQYALSYPDRWDAPELPRVSLAQIGQLNFAAVEAGRWPCLELALEAARRGGTYPAVLSAADEVAVEWFLAGRIGFLDIPRLVETALAAHQPVQRPTLNETLEADAWARSELQQRILG